MKLLLVEDDAMIGRALLDALRAEGYAVNWVRDGSTADSALASEPYDLVLLDLGLPRRDGLSVLRAMRARGSTVPVLVATARDAVGDRVAGLDAGADDYIAKPFRLAELLARVRAAARRAEPGEVRVGGVRIDVAARRAFMQDDELALSPKEFDLLARLVADAGKVVSREQLLREVWQTTWQGSSRTLDQHVSWLRGKLGADQIVTVRGKGYRFRTGDE